MYLLQIYEAMLFKSMYGLSTKEEKDLCLALPFIWENGFLWGIGYQFW